MTKQLLTFVPYLLSRSSSLADAAPLSLELCCLAPPLSSHLNTSSLSASLKSRLHNLRRSLAQLSRPALRPVPRQMLRFNALIWPAVSSSVSLIVVHLVPSKTLSSNLGELALAQTNRHLWGINLVFFLFSLALPPSPARHCSLTGLACVWWRMFGFIFAACMFVCQRCQLLINALVGRW